MINHTDMIAVPEVPTIHHAGKAVAQTSAGVFGAALLVAASAIYG